MVDDNKKIEVKNSSSIILAIILLAVYFVTDFLIDRKLVIAVIYVILLSLSVFLCNRKANFYEVIYDLAVVIILSELLKNCVRYYSNIKLIFNILANQFELPVESYIKIFSSTPYIYFYLIGVLLLLIGKFTPKLCDSNELRKVFNILGSHSLCAMVMHMCAICFTKYEFVDNVIFYVFAISAFWNAYTKDDVKVLTIVKAALLVVEISIFIFLCPEQYAMWMDDLQSVKGITWIYSVGFFIICVLCILSEKVIQDIIIGFIILGTNVLFLYGKLNQTTFEFTNIVLFNIFALSFFYVVKTIFGFEKEYENKLYLKCVLMFGYIMAFLMTIFVNNHFTQSIIMLCTGLLFMLIYFGGFINIKGTIYGTAMYGAIPWILLETTMDSLGRVSSSLFSVIVFTILFWLTSSVALSWKDTANVKAIALEKIIR